MTEDEIHKIAALELSHWWYRGTREICFATLAPYLAGRRDLRILDVGCGTGGNLLHLAAYGNAQGIDVDPLCVDYCRQKGLNVSVASMSRLNVPAAAFDLVTIFDVVDQAEAAETPAIMAGIAEALAPGGLLAIREPAMPMAAGAHDVAVHVRQRFTIASLSSVLNAAGLDVLRITYLNTLLFPPIVLLRRFQRATMPGYAASDVRATPEPLNALLLGVLRVEKQLVQVMDLPFGVSIFAIARKR
jgi:2-polyprenyl-3-methyl-5-hydroxy-6-metoxy-1,4-benzoquinol methylase